MCKGDVSEFRTKPDEIKGIKLTEYNFLGLSHLQENIRIVFGNTDKADV